MTTRQPATATSDLGPTDPLERVEAIDMVRGFALFGVLLVNMYNFGATSPVWTAPVDRAAFSVMRFFFETKSWRLFSFLCGPAYFAMFLLGLYVGRRRIFHDIPAHLPLIRSIARWGLGCGAASMAVERVLALGWGYDVWGTRGSAVPLEFVGDTLFAYGSTALSAGYAATVVLLSRSTRLRGIVEPLGPVGRLALTVYLTQSLAFTTLFYGYGLGGVGRLGPAAVTGCALAIFAIQVVACRWWVSRYRYGPVEWMWRGLTYGRFPALRVPA